MKFLSPEMNKGFPDGPSRKDEILGVILYRAEYFFVIGFAEFKPFPKLS